MSQNSENAGPSRKPAKRARRLPTIRPSTRNQSGTASNPTSSSNAPVPPSAGTTTSWMTKVTNVNNGKTNSKLKFTETIRARPIAQPSTSTSHPAEGSNSQSSVTPEGSVPSPTGGNSGDALKPPKVVTPEGSVPSPTGGGSGDTLKPPKTVKRKRVYTAKSKLVQWMALRDSTLDEILRHDGLGISQDNLCSGCEKKSTELYRCRECGHGTAVMCKICLVSNHQALPLHCIEHWNGKFFEKSSLARLGLVIQLGHDGRSCPCSCPGPQGFTVFHTSGVHVVNISYCDCSSGGPPMQRHVQLLRTQWFPATHTRPQTAFTFACLDTFHESTLQGKGNLYDYYNMLLRRTDNAGIGASIYRFPEIHRVFRLWRNMMQWKRAGRGHDPPGIDGTAQGGLTLECPACPHPDRNLPANWKESGPMLFLYTLFLAVDANFKLKGKDRKLSDIDFLPGTGVFVNDDEYQQHLKNYVEQPEINSCQSEHDAIVRASIRSTPGYAVSGVGIVICGRHCLVRRNGAGDLQKGERYCNMDFIIFSALMGVSLLCVLITYDIACQWYKNMWKRLKELPDHMKIPPTTEIKTAIPSWHINGHGPKCHENFCLGYTKGVGRTCGEEVETNWSHTNPLAASVREMALAARRDTLNDHWNGWNFRKIVGFKATFLRKFIEASKLRKKQTDDFNQLTATFNPELIQQWTRAIENWEANPSARNPYTEPTNTVTLQDVRLELSKEEKAAAEAGNISPHKLTMSAFLVNGLDLEDQQYKLRVELSSKSSKTTKKTTKKTKKKTPKKEADGQDKRTTLLRKIHKWRQAQHVYTPHAAAMVAAGTTIDENGIPCVENAENVPLYLPSAMPLHVRSTPEMKRICEMELSLRKAAAEDALFDIRRGRRNLTRLWKHKKINVSGTGNRPNTRMLTVYKRMDYKIERAAQKYRRARTALSLLDPEGTWTENLKELKKEDIRGPGKDPSDTKASNGRYKESWIWMVQRSDNIAADEETEFNDDMKVEWAKVRARKLRWDEEYLLVQEEMRRVLAWSEWKAEWWETQANKRTSAEPEVLHGIKAYAHKQAHITLRMAEECALEWLPVLREAGIEPDWPSRFMALTPPSVPRGRHWSLQWSPEELINNEEVLEGMESEDDDYSGESEEEKEAVDFPSDESDDEFDW